jgi:alcohol dehydrogenase class IV
VVTDQGLKNFPFIQVALNQMQSEGLFPHLFSEVQPNPSGENVEAGVQAFKDAKADGVIAIGGGSALDAGKAIALMVGQDRPIWDFEDVGDNYTRVKEDGIVPCIAVPTTAGTGSEVGRASVILDTDAHLKKIIFHPKVLPDLVILDPEVTIELPPHITAATGMDALSHALEAYCAPTFHPMAEGIALQAMKMVQQYLPEAVSNPSAIEARSQMLVASTMGATAFQKGLGAMHALAHPLGAYFNAHHGLLNAVLMPYVLEANAVAIQDKMQTLGKWLALPQANLQGVIHWVLDLRKQLNIPHTLKEMGVALSEESIVLIANEAVKDPSAQTNPIELSSAEYQSILRQAQ